MPTSFSISCLVTLGAKPNLCISSCRVLLFLTHPLNLFSLLRGKFSLLVLLLLLETCLISLWNSTFPPHAPVSILLFVAKVRLSPLDSVPTHNVVTWTDCSIPFLYFLSGYRSVLSSALTFTSISLADLAETVFYFLLYHQASMSPQILVFPGKRRG